MLNEWMIEWFAFGQWENSKQSFLFEKTNRMTIFRKKKKKKIDVLTFTH